MNETMVELNKRKLINDMAKFAISGLISEAMFKYAAIKGINLHFTFSHPAAKQIFELNTENIKAKLREFWADNLAAIKEAGVTFRDISCEVIYRLPRDGKAMQEEKKPYEEPSNGSFENRAKDPSIRLKIERIRKIILADLESGKSVYKGNI
jgi:hypothetical protein|uniref:Uncharacterized protein n=1 Tax=Siphoviridae sp. ctUfO3 TaxID=2823584 RepID=A0A8S5LC58_9CAUD|nr:MAG TPA: hypothetical protein [Siphoviridae sp. ctUfO3]